MSTPNDFSIGAAGDSGHVPTAPGVMPQFLQVQVNGVNLGGPDADTINFVGFVVTRLDKTVTVTLG